jgi:hypothetical protein
MAEAPLKASNAIDRQGLSKHVLTDGVFFDG